MNYRIELSVFLSTIVYGLFACDVMSLVIASVVVTCRAGFPAVEPYSNSYAGVKLPDE